MFWRAISGYVEMALIVGLIVWGVGMMFCAVFGTAISMVRLIPLHVWVLLVLVCVFLSMAG